MARQTRRGLALAAVAFIAVTGIGIGTAQAEFPEKPIKVVVPTQAGGGMDSTARILQRYFDENEELGVKFAVVNMPGAGGTIGTRTIKDADPDGYTIGFWHEGIITSNAMGVVDYNHEDFEVLGSTGFGILGFGVGENSEIDSFEQLLETARANPDQVKNAANVGLPVHFVPLMVADEADVEFRYVQVGGGAKRFPSVVAGHTDFAIFGLIEFVKWKDAELRPVVLFAEERSPLLPDVPTAKEHGLDIVVGSSRIWLAPKGTPPEVTAKLVEAMQSAMEDPGVQQQFADLGLEPVYISPEKVVADLDWWRSKAEPLVAKARELQQ
ncbi:MAG: tripartite tricarboxylate transporter substrate binding protein [Pseudomonadota bacterium]